MYLELVIILILSIFITYLIVSSILGKNHFFHWLQSAKKQRKSKNFIRNLERIDYFKLHSTNEKQKHLESIHLFSNNRKGIQKLVNKFSFKYDKRLYLIDIDKDVLLIQKEGGDDKWIEIVSDRNDLTNSIFLNFASQIGLSVTLNEPIVYSEESEFASFKFMINQTTYDIQYSYPDDAFLIARFVASLNTELTKINAESSFYLYDYLPAILVYANEKTINYLNSLNSEKGREILTTEKWRQKITSELYKS